MSGMILPCRDLRLSKTKIVVAHASSAYKHSLREVLESPGIAGQIKVFILAANPCPSDLVPEQVASWSYIAQESAALQAFSRH